MAGALRPMHSLRELICQLREWGEQPPSAVGFDASSNPFAAHNVSSEALEMTREGACAPLSISDLRP
ncbi:MAG TPA: hypothetical protein VMA13_00595 [Candidatus Saccharimonadales bacterium]|nr:hypothetical protein [Candidatus Saccharimonadales bacterium]